jgi:hypothetical protein
MPLSPPVVQSWLVNDVRVKNVSMQMLTSKCTKKHKIFIIQERERGIIVVNIVPEEILPKTPIQKHNATTKLANAIALLLHLVHVDIIFGMFL